MSLSKLFEMSRNLNYNQSNGMICVDKMKGPGFFPCCMGTIDSRQNITGLPVMVLGQDFDTAANYKLIDEQNGEIAKNTTWRNLRQLLGELGINERKCFFTNVYMGLRPGTNSKTRNTGKSPAAQKGAEKFAADCYGFFREQLEVVRPVLVLVLGKETARFLSKVFSPEFKEWAEIKTLKSFYDNENNTSITLEFEGRIFHFFFVIHPSLNNTNRSKTWDKEQGKNQEQDLLKKSIKRKIPTMVSVLL